MDLINQLQELDSYEVINNLKKQDIDKIVEALELASNAYRNTDEVLISDDTYDLLEDKLKKLDKNNKFLKKIGAPVTGEKVSLPIWMGSLDKIRDDSKQLEKWTNKYKGEVVISDKLDGNSGLLHIKDGKTKMYSRGDGSMGQDISQIVKYVKGIKGFISLSASSNVEILIRGELIISKMNWEEIKDLGANARNVVAGMLHSKEPNPIIASLIDFVSYEVYKPKQSKLSDAFEFITANDGSTPYYEKHNTSELSSSYLQQLLLKRRNESHYEIDGLVVYHNSDHSSRVIKGSNPKYAIAFKSMLTHDEVTVTVKKIEWNVSKHGFLKPTIIFDPVSLNGVTIQRATGNNAYFIESNKIGKDAQVIIIRSGDVIPKVIRVLKNATNYIDDFPSKEEFGEYDWNDTHIDFVLVDKDHQDVKLKTMMHFCSSMEMKNIAEGTLKKLMDQAGIDSINKLLSINLEDIMRLEGFQQTSAQKVYNSILKVKSEATCVDYMVASNIFGRGLGRKKIELMVKEIPSIVSYVIPTIDQLISIKSIGKATAESFIDNFIKFKGFMDEIGVSCDSPQSVNEPQNHNMNMNFKDKIIVFTGFRNSEWEKIIKSSGGQVTGSVSKKTTLVVASDLNDNSSKVVRARELGINLISKEEFSSKFRLDNI